MPHGVNAGNVVPPITNLLPTRFTSCVPQSAVRPFPHIHILLRTNGLYIPSWFLTLLIVDGRSECPLGTLSLLTCDYAAGVVLYSLHVLTLMCHSLLLFLSLMDPLPP